MPAYWVFLHRPEGAVRVGPVEAETAEAALDRVRADYRACLEAEPDPTGLLGLDSFVWQALPVDPKAATHPDWTGESPAARAASGPSSPPQKPSPPS